MKSVLFFIFLFSNLSYAARYIIPSDENVFKVINPSLSNRVELDPSDINVLVWNIYKGGIVSWERDFLSLARGKDLLVLQEAFLGPRMLKTFYSTIDMEYLFATAWIDGKYGNNPTGVTTASTVKASEVDWQRSYYLEPLIKTPKMTLFTSYKIAGMQKELLVGNIHGINFVRAYKLRHMLDKAAEVIKKHNGPVLFAGDFNTWTSTKLANMNAVFKSLKMKKIQFKNDIRKTIFGKIIDFAWIKNLSVLESAVPNVKGSDHKPMTFKLKVTSEPIQ